MTKYLYFVLDLLSNYFIIFQIFSFNVILNNEVYVFYFVEHHSLTLSSSKNILFVLFFYISLDTTLSFKVHSVIIFYLNWLIKNLILWILF